MKRLLTLLLLALMLATFSRGVIAQDATPTADSSLISALDYPVIEYTTDGTTLTGPTELEAGRYQLKVLVDNPIEDWSFDFYSPSEGMTADELLTSLAGVDTTADEAPDFFYQIGQGGGVESPGNVGIVQLTEGEWVATVMFYGESPSSVATQKVTVTGELPEYTTIEDAIDVTLADLSIEMPDVIAAGPHVWQVTNTGALPHFVFIMNPGGELTTEDAVNGVKLFYGMADATPAAEGSAQDPMSWQDVGGSSPITNGVTTFFELDLEPGTYIAFCFIEGPGELGSHALHGMTKVFTVA